MSGDRAVVLFGHGARDPAWAEPMRRVRDQLVAGAPDVGVELAFLEFIEPTLDVAIHSLVARGARRIVVVPMFIAQGGHLKADLPKLVTAARVRHPGCEIVQTLAVGEADPVIAAMADYARRCATGDVG
ncbi:MAG: CbiX/SirB N-terminal domain-containing protein [Aromatoleum sp.]|uniref:sirohydrochlorin chelatase n=1 Tax=Aromatoleum sp. TaxID=2307007 RepID=UPI0028957328|nr:CbiX/SirB N-terminal domain-containing protein [Aromatoleum sp.]MDT3672025.1 CbiX/SirB N-terminal domain-containing protein [Aromatoleum sp.]